MVSKALRSPDGYKFIGDAAGLGDCYNVVASLADLPAPVAGVRTLPTDQVTLVCGAITLPPGERIVAPADAVLLGRDADHDGFFGDVDGPLVSANLNGLVIDNLFLRNPNPGADAFCIRTTSLPLPDARVSRIGGNAISLGGTRGLLIEDAVTVDVFRVLSRCNVAGIVLRGNNFGVSIFGYTSFPDAPATAVGILFDAGSTTNGLRCVNGFFPLFDPASRSIERDLTAAINLGVFIANEFVDSLGGVANGLVNLSADGNDATIFAANIGVQESRNGGGASIGSNPADVPTVVPAVDTWVRIGEGNAGTHPAYVLDPSSARVLLDQPGGAPSAALRWSGVASGDTTATNVCATLSLRSATGAAPRALAARLIRIPAGGGPDVPITPAITTVDAGAVSFGASLALSGNIALEPGDGLAVEVQNRTDGDNIIVDAVNLSFEGK